MADRESLLLVEDDGATRELLTILLEAEGWTVEAVESGEAAVATLQRMSASTAVALCDLHLPGLCGEDLARALHDVVPGMCIVAMSASAAKPVPGYWAGLLKPFPPSSVRQEWERFRSDCTSSDPAALVHADSASSHETPNPETATLPDTPVLDLAVLQKLQGTMGAAAAQGLYAFALADTGDRLRRMAGAAATGDTDLFRREAHAIKGSCGMIGARRLCRLAHSAELDLPGATSAQKVVELLAETSALRLMLESQFPVQQQMP